MEKSAGGCGTAKSGPSQSHRGPPSGGQASADAVAAARVEALAAARLDDAARRGALGVHPAREVALARVQRGATSVHHLQEAAIASLDDVAPLRARAHAAQVGGGDGDVLVGPEAAGAAGEAVVLHDATATGAL